MNTIDIIQKRLSINELVNWIDYLKIENYEDFLSLRNRLIRLNEKLGSSNDRTIETELKISMIHGMIQGIDQQEFWYRNENPKRRFEEGQQSSNKKSKYG